MPPRRPGFVAIVLARCFKTTSRSTPLPSGSQTSGRESGASAIDAFRGHC